MCRLILAATSALCLACTPSPKPNTGPEDAVPATPEAVSPPATRHFAGALEVSSDKSIDWLIRFEPGADGSDGKAQLWIPEQNVDSLVASSATNEGEALVMKWEPIKLGWTIAGDGKSCEFSQSGISVPCDLEEIDAEDFADYIAVDRPQNPEPPFPYAIEDLRVDNPEAEGVTLAGTLTIPEGEGPFPALVLVSGSGAQDRDETIFGHRPFWIIADTLTRRGIAVMRYDDRGWAASTGNPEGTSVDFAGDALAVLRAVAKRPEIDASKVGIIGHSEGGLIAPYLAARHPDELAFIVMLAGPGVVGHELLALQSELNMRLVESDEDKVKAEAALFADIYELVATKSEAEVGEAVKARWRETKGDEDSAALTGLMTLVNDPWMRFFLAHDPGPDLAQVRCPVLALIGTTDVQVDDEQNLPAIEAALAKGKNGDATVLARPGLNHLFQHSETGSPADYGTIPETFDPETLVLIGDWLIERTSR